MANKQDYSKDDTDSSMDLSIVPSLSESLDVSHLNLDVYTVKECEDEIIRCRVMNTHYRRLTYLIAINTGMHNYTGNINYYFLSDIMKKQASQFVAFVAFTTLAWTIKPIYGWISDSIYPFKFRFKPYVTLMQILYVLLAGFIASNTFNYQEETDTFNFKIFRLAVLLLNISVAFIYSLA